MNKRLLITSIMSIALLASVTTGATYALFAVEDEANVAITAGEVAVTAVVDQASLKTYSLGEEQVSGFANGGTATFDAESNLALSLMTPGDAAEFTVKIDNASTIKTKYRISVLLDGELAPALAAKAVVNGVEQAMDGKPSEFITVEIGADIPDVPVRVELPVEAENQWQGKSAKVSVLVEVLQANAPVADEWDGTASYEWLTANPDATEFSLSSAEDLAGLAKLLDGTAPVTLDDGSPLPSVNDKHFTLTADVDLGLKDDAGEYIPFDPIGSYRFDQVFTGTFDGAGHTIRNMKQNTWALDNGYSYHDCGLGLFGALEGATIKNLVMDGATISGESALCGTIAAVAGEGCTFENISVINSQVADYQYYAGGIVGWASGTQVYNNCHIDASTTIAAQWGDFDNALGGVIGGLSSSDETHVTIKNTTVACRIDATNDVVSAYQWYNYRRSGMLIGESGHTQAREGQSALAICPQLTCENVTVIYGDWANYTYCEFAGTGFPYVRVQEGFSVGAYTNVRYGHPTDANGETVVDDNHVHNDGEDHHMLLVFDQLYGGGKGVSGNPVHEGVNVVYNNR